MIRRAVKTATLAGFSPSDRCIWVSIGAGHGFQLEGMDIEVVENSEWETGQSSSIRAGLRKLGDRCGAAIFMLVDQPFVIIGIAGKAEATTS